MTPTQDWAEHQLGDLVSLSNGINADKSAYGSGVPFINVLEVITNESLLSTHIPGRISVADNVRSRYLVKRGDVLFNRTSETEEEVGLSSVYLDDLPVVFGGFVFRGRPTTETLDAKYSAYALRASDVRKQIIARGQGGIRTNIGQRDLRSVILRVPGKQEQRAIAEALTDADELVCSLERLIAKKQAIKQGMIQQLLTGRMRLPGFEGEWTPVRLRDAGSTYGGLVGKSKDDFGTGPAQFVTFMEVMAGVRLCGARLERVSVGPAERQNRVLRGDVLFNGSSETPEEVALAAVVDYDTSPRTYLNSFCFGYRLKARDQIDPTYLAHFFRSGQGRDAISVLAQGATRYNISKTKLMQIAPLLPRIEEQRAIVEVLNGSEAEIDALDLRLAKARAIKTGMMQQLLTGRVRLPLEAAS